MSVNSMLYHYSNRAPLFRKEYSQPHLPLRGTFPLDRGKALGGSTALHSKSKARHTTTLLLYSRVSAPHSRLPSY